MVLIIVVSILCCVPKCTTQYKPIPLLLSLKVSHNKKTVLSLLAATHLFNIVFYFQDRSPGELSEDDDMREYPDFSSNDDNSDVEPLPGDDEWTSRFRKLRSMKPALALRVCLY
jgi:hypothetical protein